MSRAGLILPAHHRPDPSGLGTLALQPVQLEPSPRNYMRRGSSSHSEAVCLTVDCTMLQMHVSEGTG